MVHAAVQALPDDVRSGVQQRAQAHLRRYAQLIEGWSAPWDIAAVSEEAFDALSDALAAEPCPALGAEGGCLIYERRPATCRMTGLGMLTQSGDLLENVCPIQEQFPAYEALPPTPLDLRRFEALAEGFDVTAAEAGWKATTVVGVVGGSTEAEPRGTLQHKNGRPVTGSAVPRLPGLLSLESHSYRHRTSSCTRSSMPSSSVRTPQERSRLTRRSSMFFASVIAPMR